MDVFERNIDTLIELIEQKTGPNSVLYIELISVEIRENSLFNIKCKGVNVDKYDKEVRDHLRNNKNSSLLLLKHNNDDPFLFLRKQFYPLVVTPKTRNKLVYRDRHRKYRKIDELRGQDVIEIQWNGWLDMARRSFPSMYHAFFLHSNLVFPFPQNPVTITSGIWVFLSQQVFDQEGFKNILKLGLYENITYTLLPEKIKQLEVNDTFTLLWHSLVGQVGMLTKKARELEKRLTVHETLLEEEKLTIEIDQFREYFSVARCIQFPLYYIESQKNKKVEPAQVSLKYVVEKIINKIYYDIENNHNSFGAPRIVWDHLKKAKQCLFSTSFIKNDIIIIYEALIEVILYNLITNAVKNISDFGKPFISEELPMVKIKITQIKKDEEFIRFSIYNSRRIDDIHFKNWHDFKYAHYENGKRTSGLGIYTCKSFINALNFKKSVRRGTDFTRIIITIPKQLKLAI